MSSYCHATPDDNMPMTTVFTPDDDLRAACSVRSGTFVIGHTHHQFDRRVGDLRVVNAGSVGMAYEGEVAAFWTMVVDGEPEFRKTSFDVERAIREHPRRATGTARRSSSPRICVWPSARDEAAAHFESQR